MNDTTQDRRRSSLVQVGGALGIAAVCIALAVFVVALFNFEAVFILSPLPTILAAIGLVVAIVGGVRQKHVHDQETQPLAALFVTILGLLMGIIEMAIWLR
ncbi:hypothetical protein [Fontivita pretiosa]|uniref:hypothetical protein n=1 Tax=Fontivita pretiosa TaxID=2989684 RepID=UPI003D1695F5